MEKSIFMKTTLLGDKISLYRKKQNLSQKQVAQLTGIGLDTYMKHESGIFRPSIKNPVLLSKIFRITPDELLS